MVRERTKLWGFEMGGNRFSGILGDDESISSINTSTSKRKSNKPKRLYPEKDMIKIIKPWK